MLKFWKLILVLLSVLVITTNVWADTSATLRSNVKVLVAPNSNAANAIQAPGQGTMLGVQAQENSAGTMTLDGSVANVGVGDVLVSSQGQGFLKKVTAVRARQEGHVVVETQQGTLLDVFSQADISISKTFTAKDLEGTRILLPGMTIEGPAAPVHSSNNAILASAPALNFNFNHTPVQGQGGSIDFDGTVSVQPSVDLDLQIRTFPPRLTKCRFVPQVTGNVNVKVTASKSISFANKKVLYAMSPPVTFYVPVNPLVTIPVTAALGFYLNVNGSMSAEFSITDRASLTIGGGFDYQDGSGLKPVTIFRHSASATIETNSGIDFSFTPLRPELTFYLWSLKGPYLFVDAPKISAHIGPRGSQLCYNVKATVVGGAAFDAELLGVGVHLSTSLETASIDIADSCFGSGGGGGGSGGGGGGGGGTTTPPRPQPTSKPPSPGGYDYATFVADRTYADSPDAWQTVDAGRQFQKVWRIKNTGNRSWGAGYRWAFDGKAQMGAPNSIAVPFVAPGQTWDPAVDMRAPGSPGVYQGFWRMQAPDGHKFGDRMWVKIGVSGSTTSPQPSVGTYVSESRLAAEGQPGFYRRGTAAWWNDSFAYGADGHMLWTYSNGSSTNNSADWRPVLPESRWYEVKVFIPRWFGSTTQAHYTIFHADGQTERVISQLAYSDAWVSLGKYRFNSGTGGFLRLEDRGNAYGTKWIAFDAAKWDATEPPPPPPPPPVPAGGAFVSESDSAASFDSVGFFRRGTPAYWKESSQYGEGGHMLWTYNNDPHAGDNIGSWRPNLPDTRWYEVYAYIPRWYASTAHAHYSITHADGRAEVYIPQINYSDTWVSLGTYRFNAGTQGYTELFDLTGDLYASKWIGFDAMKWEPRDGAPPVPNNVTTFVSESDSAPFDGAAGFYRHGTPRFWQDDYNHGDGGHMLWTYNNDPGRGIDNMGDWRPNLPRAGKYELFVYIPNYHATTNQAHYEIYHADGRTNVTLNQADKFNVWVSLGTYRWNAGTSGLLRLIDRTDEGYASKWIGFDSAKWESRPGTARAPSDLSPRDGVQMEQSVNLSWHDNEMDDGNASIDFRIQMWRVQNGNRAEQVWVSDWRAETSRPWTAPEPGEYEWIVEASNGNGQSAVSPAARFIVRVPRPEIPSELAARAVSPYDVDLLWRDNSKIEAGFAIERKSGAEAWAEIARVDADVVSYRNTGLTSKTQYLYRVRALGSAQSSDFSGEAKVTTLQSYPLVSIAVSPDYTSGAQTVTGTVTLAGAAPTGGAVVALSSNNPKARMPSQVTIPAGKNFVEFAVKTSVSLQADVATLSASFLGEIQTTTLAMGTPNRAPVLAKATFNLTQNVAFSARLAGSDADKDRLTYKVVKGTLPTGLRLYGNGSLRGTPTVIGSNIVKIEVSDGKGGTGSANITINVTAPPVLPAPLLLSATGEAGQVRLSWDDRAKGETGYKIERLTNGRWSLIARGTTPNQTSYLDENLTAGVSYSYRVSAYISGVAVGRRSNVASAKALGSSAAAMTAAALSAGAG